MKSQLERYGRNCLHINSLHIYCPHIVYILFGNHSPNGSRFHLPSFEHFMTSFLWSITFIKCSSNCARCDRLISYLLYGLFSAEKKGNVFQYPLARARGHSRSCSLNRLTRPCDRNQKNFSSLVIDKIVNFSRYLLFSPSHA